MNDYGEMFKMFLNDDRIQLGIKVLIETYFNHTIESTKSMISTLIQNDKNEEPQTNSDGLLTSISSYDLFKLINEGFDLTYQVSQHKEVLKKLANYGKVLLNYYQSTIEEFLVNNI